MSGLQMMVGGTMGGYCNVYQKALNYAAANGFQAPYYSADRTREDNLIRSFVASGLWDAVDQFAFLSSYASSDWALLNIKNPGSAVSVAKRDNYTFTLGKGFWHRIVGDSLKTNFVPSVNGINYTQNECGIVFVTYSVAAGTVTELEMLGSGGVANANGVSFSPSRNSNNQGARSNAANLNSSSNTSIKGRYHIARTASNVYKIRKNGTITYNGTEASTGLSAFEIYLLAFNQNNVIFEIGVTTEFLASLWMIGGSWNSLAADLDSALSTLETSDTAIFTISSGSNFPSYSSFSGDKDSYLSAFAVQKALYSSWNDTPYQLSWISTAVANISQGGALAANDAIYCAPSTGSQICKINTLTDAVTYFGSHTAASQKWLSAVFCPSNGKVYCVPYNATCVLVIDTSNDSTYYLDTTGVIGTTSGNLTGTSKWSQGLLGSDGYIYFVAYDCKVWAKVNPATDAITYYDSTGVIGAIGSGNLTEGAKCDGGIPYGDYLYGSPSSTQRIYKFDVVNQRVLVSGNVLPVGSNKYYAANLAPNGYIYFMPYSGTDILKLNPADDSFTNFGTFSGAGIKILGSTILPNGNIFCMSGNLTQNGVIIDTTNDVAKSIPDLWNVFTSASMCGCFLAKNGCIYAIPSGANRVLKMKPIKTAFTIDAKFVMSRYQNKY